MGTVIRFPIERTHPEVNEPVPHPGWLCLACPELETCTTPCEAVIEREREYEAQGEEGWNAEGHPGHW